MCEVSRLLVVLTVVVYILSDSGRGVSASLETDAASHAAAVAAAAAASGYKGRLTGRCERITIPLCLDMKYNMTRMPNLVGHSTQAEAAMQVCYNDLWTFRPIVSSPLVALPPTWAQDVLPPGAWVLTE